CLSNRCQTRRRNNSSRHESPRPKPVSPRCRFQGSSEQAAATRWQSNCSRRSGWHTVRAHCSVTWRPSTRSRLPTSESHEQLVRSLNGRSGVSTRQRERRLIWRLFLVVGLQTSLCTKWFICQGQRLQRLFQGSRTKGSCAKSTAVSNSATS